MSLIYGKNTVANALAHNDGVQRVWIGTSFKDERIFRLLKEKKIPFQAVSSEELGRMAHRAVHQGIVAEVKEYAYLSLNEIIEKNKDDDRALLVLLDGIEDPHNLGAIVRSVDAFGGNGIIIGANRQVEITPTVAKVSTGAIEYVDVCQTVNLHQAVLRLKEAGYWIVSSDGEAKRDYRDVDYRTKIVLIVGSEGKGIRPLLLKNSDYTVRIPMTGHVNSLNASVACAVFLSQIFSQRNPLK